MTERHVVAMGGGGFMMDDPLLDRFVLGLVDAGRPRICFVPTASGDADRPIARFFDAFPARSFEPCVLRLFDRSVEDVVAFLVEQDVVYVGGGNTLNMLAIWRRHGVDAAMRTAWDAGVVMAGVSAGANCWFEASTTDSWLVDRADPLLDGLGFVPGSFTPHYSTEPARQPSLLALIGAGELPDGYACDDFAALHLVDREVREAVASRSGARATRVRRDGDTASEEPLPTRSLT